jgi:hypothetical protein
VSDRGFARVENYEQFLGQILVGPFTQFFLVASNALAVIIELGFDSQHRVAELVAFSNEFSNINFTSRIGNFETLFATGCSFKQFVVSRRGLFRDLSVT